MIDGKLGDMHKLLDVIRPRYRVTSGITKSQHEFIQPEFDEEGRAFVEALGEEPMQYDCPLLNFAHSLFQANEVMRVPRSASPSRAQANSAW